MIIVLINEAEDLVLLMINHRKILHLDMDYFYAQVEMRDDPSLQDKLVVVSKNDDRSVILTASYNARKLGIYAGMSLAKAKQLSNQLCIIKPHMEKYKMVHKQIISIIEEYSDIIEPVSLDEAYIDVTYNKKGIQEALWLAKELQYKIKKQLNLTCSIGISYNKFLAKIGSDYHKPFGLCVINKEDSIAFLKQLPINKFIGIGKKNLAICAKHAIFKGEDLLTYKKTQLQLLFGEKYGAKLYNYVRGIDESVVNNHRPLQSIGCEYTLSYDLSNQEELLYELQRCSLELQKRLLKKEVCCRTIVLKLKFNDFRQITRMHTLNYYITKQEDIYKEALKLLTKCDIGDKKIRLIGLSASKFAPLNTLMHQKKYEQIYLNI